MIHGGDLGGVPIRDVLVERAGRLKHCKIKNEKRRREHEKEHPFKKEGNNYYKMSDFSCFSCSSSKKNKKIVTNQKKKKTKNRRPENQSNDHEGNVLLCMVVTWEVSQFEMSALKELF